MLPLLLPPPLYAKQSDLTRAIDYSRRAVRADPQNGGAYAMLAVVLYKSGGINKRAK